MRAYLVSNFSVLQIIVILVHVWEQEVPACPSYLFSVLSNHLHLNNKETVWASTALQATGKIFDNRTKWLTSGFQEVQDKMEKIYRYMIKLLCD